MRTRTHRRVNRSMQVRLSARRHMHMHGLPLGSLDRFWATIFGPPCAPNCSKFGAFGHRFLNVCVCVVCSSVPSSSAMHVSWQRRVQGTTLALSRVAIVVSSTPEPLHALVWTSINLLKSSSSSFLHKVCQSNLRILISNRGVGPRIVLGTQVYLGGPVP